MIDVATAWQLIQDRASVVETTVVPVASAIDRWLAEDVVADIDAPPFDKSMMDGFAVDSARLRGGERHLKVAGQVTAGEVPEATLAPGETVAIMTGAPIPRGADAVVMLEQTSMSRDQQRVSIDAETVEKGQNILRCAAVFSKGQVVLHQGQRLRPQHVGLLVEAGAAKVRVRRPAAAAILNTGNELCSADAFPAPGQIRNSNGPLLASLLVPYADVLMLGIAGDRVDDLENSIRRGLSSDILIVTGGVSTGELDLLPATFTQLGVKQAFHRIALKPGKPVWFGTHQSDSHRCLVFGLPGNPVSSFVCCVLFVLHAVRLLAGENSLPKYTGTLLQDHRVRGDRPTYWPARFSMADGVVHVRPLVWLGSADQRCLAETNCLAIFPVGNKTYEAGHKLDFIALEAI